MSTVVSYLGKVQNGVVILDDDAKLPEGTLVRVEAVASRAVPPQDGRALLLNLAGSVDDLPPDLAINHDHYLHGHPKK